MMDDHPTRRLNQPATARPECPTRRLESAPPRRIRRPPTPASESDEELGEAPPEPKQAEQQEKASTYPCPKCGGTEVAVRVHSQSNLYLQRYFGFLNWRNSNIGAYTCTDCGYTELYAADPANLRGD